MDGYEALDNHRALARSSQGILANRASMSDKISVTLKLYASLGSHLPPGAERNTTEVEAESGASIQSLLDSQNVPREACHLVLLNGIFQPRDRRTTSVLSDGDTVAVWPPVAGG